MRGVILAGGRGTRLLPATKVVNKHMIPILNKPMIIYPIETLRAFGVEDVLIVSGGGHIGGIAEFLGDGSDFGVDITYKVQKEAGGIAQALGMAKGFARGEKFVTILGDNIFDNTKIPQIYEEPWNAHLFIKRDVPDMRRFGVLRTDHDTGKMTIIEKPDIQNWSDAAIVGLYVYPNLVFDILPGLVPSARGELEISDVNNWFLENEKCGIHEMDGFWSDAGTPDSLKEVIDWAYTTEKTAK